MSDPAPRWLPQDAALVRFVDDPALLHYRLVLLCPGGDHCLVATPDRDINDVQLVEGEVFFGGVADAAGTASSGRARGGHISS